MKKERQNLPYSALGRRLQRMRISRQQSLAEVSGAVEIDVDQLSKIEQGSSRPNEDILLLLISHFEAKETEADSLWQLAGYDDKDSSADAAEQPQQPVMIAPDDLKIVYTDMVHVMVNNYGVVMNFMQGGAPNGQPLAVSRIGMSREHALSVLELLQKTLKSDVKQLPAQKD